MVNKILSIHFIEEIALVYRISQSNVIYEIFKFTITQIEIELNFWTAL